MTTLYIVRGLPGSGKSIFAKKLATDLNCMHIETDMYWMVDGVYCFDAKRLGAAHEWCMDTALIQISNGNSVVVSNTFVTDRTIRAYLNDPSCDFHNIDENYNVVVYEMTGQYGNIHNVPQETLDRMARSWVPNSELAKMSWHNPIEFHSV